jgi:hypothetical protein
MLNRFLLHESHKAVYIIRSDCNRIHVYHNRSTSWVQLVSSPESTPLVKAPQASDIRVPSNNKATVYDGENERAASVLHEIAP